MDNPHEYAFNLICQRRHQTKQSIIGLLIVFVGLLWCSATDHDWFSMLISVAYWRRILMESSQREQPIYIDYFWVTCLFGLLALFCRLFFCQIIWASFVILNGGFFFFLDWFRVYRFWSILIAWFFVWLWFDGFWWLANHRRLRSRFIWVFVVGFFFNVMGFISHRLNYKLIRWFDWPLLDQTAFTQRWTG